jgi:nucleotide-binding universal stress UspA family protein
MVENIAAAIDGSEASHRAVELASEFAVKFGAKLHLVYVIEHLRLSEQFLEFAEAEGIGPHQEPLSLIRHPGPIRTGRPYRGPVVSYEMMEKVAEKVIVPARQTAEERGVKAIHSEVLRGDPAEVLSNYVKVARIDLLFAGRRGLSQIVGLVLGSVSAKLLSHADGTVITVP